MNLKITQLIVIKLNQLNWCNIDEEKTYMNSNNDKMTIEMT